MIKLNILPTFFITIALIIFAIILGAPRSVTAAPEGSRAIVCESLNKASDKGVNEDCSESAGGLTVLGTFKNFLGVLSFIAGIATVILIVIGGFKYVVSQGEPGATASAKKNILFALIGAVIVLLSQTIVRFLLDSV